MKIQNDIINKLSGLGLLLLFLFTVALSVVAVLFVLNAHLRETCGREIIDSIQLFYDPS